VGFEMLVVPAMASRMGLPVSMRATLKARCRGPWARPGGRRRFRPARLVTGADGILEVERLPWSGSGDPSTAALAEALVALPFGPDEEGGDHAIADVVLLEVRR
jgi:molybdopterin biosynthesis enzyme